MGIKPKVGDVFLIPLDDTSAAGGLVISIREGEELYLAVFDRRLSLQEIDPKTVISGLPALLALSFDAKFWHGNWRIIGNEENLIEQYPQPNYKVRYAGVMSLESRDRSVIRPASPEELEILKFRSVSSPSIVERAVKALFGIGKWDKDDDELLAEYASISSRLV